MAYSPGFPIGYQPAQFYYPQPQQNQMSPAQTQQNSITWVQGEAGAKSYMVAPNTTAQLWDSERQTIYLKSADASGMPSIKVLDYTIRQEGSQSVSSVLNSETPMEVSRKDLDVLQRQIDALKDELRACRATINEGKGVGHGESDL